MTFKISCTSLFSDTSSKDERSIPEFLSGDIYTKQSKTNDYLYNNHCRGFYPISKEKSKASFPVIS